MVAIAKATATKFGLDPALVCAICEHESNGWQPWASRYERGFFARYILPMTSVKTYGPTCSKDTERTARATSYGLMQVMGQTARERGFTGEYLTELCDPEVGIDVGCRYLVRCFRLAGDDLRGALLKYNGGGNPTYPDLVLAHLADYQ